MRTKRLLFFLLLLMLGSLATRPVLADLSPTPSQPTAVSFLLHPAAQTDDASSAESSDLGTGLIIGLSGATLVIGLTAVGVLLNRRNKNKP